MARVDYYAIESGVKTILEADATLTGTKVTIEEEMIFSPESTPWVGIYLDRRDAPANLQQLAAGKTTKFLVRLSIWCWEYSLESLAKAIQLRDDLVGKVELALMAARTLNGTVSMSWLEGGEMPSAKGPNDTDWLSGAEIILVAEVTART